MLQPTSYAAAAAFVLRPQGEIAARSVERLQADWQNHLDHGHLHWIVDLNEASMIDSSGLGLFVQYYTALKSRGGSLTVVTTNPRFVDLFRITRLDQRIALRATVPN